MGDPIPPPAIPTPTHEKLFNRQSLVDNLVLAVLAAVVFAIIATLAYASGKIYFTLDRNFDDAKKAAEAAMAAEHKAAVDREGELLKQIAKSAQRTEELQKNLADAIEALNKWLATPEGQRPKSPPIDLKNFQIPKKPIDPNLSMMKWVEAFQNVRTMNYAVVPAKFTTATQWIQRSDGSMQTETMEVPDTPERE